MCYHCTVRLIFAQGGEYRNMVYDLQKAGLWKRIAAGVFDVIITVILATGVAFLLSAVFGYNSYDETFNTVYAEYEKEYGVTFDIASEDYAALTDAEKQVYDAAYKAFIGDETVLYSYNMIVNLSLLITTLSLLITYLLLEFSVPLIFGNGQTLGKKIFGIGLVRTDSVKLTNFQLFVRTVLGKYTIETMIPVYIIMMIFWNMMDIAGAFVIIVILLVQLVMITVTKTNSLLHDMLAVTAAVELGSQMIFDTPEAKIEYQKKIAAERAARQTY